MSTVPKVRSKWVRSAVKRGKPWRFVAENLPPTEMAQVPLWLVRQKTMMLWFLDVFKLSKAITYIPAGPREFFGGTWKGSPQSTVKKPAGSAHNNEFFASIGARIPTLSHWKPDTEGFEFMDSKLVQWLAADPEVRRYMAEFWWEHEAIVRGDLGFYVGADYDVAQKEAEAQAEAEKQANEPKWT